MTLQSPCCRFSITIFFFIALIIASSSMAQGPIPFGSELPPTISIAPTPAAPLVAALLPRSFSPAPNSLLVSTSSTSTTSPRQSPLPASAPSPVAAAPPALPLAPDQLSPSNLIPAEPPVDPPSSSAHAQVANAATLMAGIIIGGAAITIFA
ncbi:hypothetical protein Dimus_008981 [Dionaea muscipula]